MKIAHISDSHLGFSAYRKVDEVTGINQREVDLYSAFVRCVDAIIDSKVDVALHSGDLFDTVRPSNRAISFALEQLIRLTDAGVEVVLIAGNHSAPKLRETGSVFKIFEHLDKVHPVYQGKYEVVEIGDLAVHAVPHADRQVMMDQLDQVKLDRGRKFNVLMLHAGLIGVGVFGMGEFNEQLVPTSYLRTDVDYIALGHFHEFTKVTENARYAGSIERLSFGESSHDKGFVLVDLARKRIEFRRLHCRPMIDLSPIDAKGLDAGQLMAMIREKLEGSDLADAIVRLNVENISGSQYRSLDHLSIRRWAGPAMHFDARFDMSSNDIAVQTHDMNLTALDQEFVSFLDKYPVEIVSKDAVREKGLDYIRRGLEGSE